MRGVVDPLKVEYCGDHVETGTGNVIAVLEVTPLSFDVRTKREVEAIHHRFQELLDTVSYPVYIHSRQEELNLEDHVRRLDGRELSELRGEYVEYCQRLDRVIETRHYIVLGVEARESAVRILGQRMEDVARYLQSVDLEVDLLVDERLERFVDRVENQDPEVTSRYVAVPNDGFDEYRRLAYITEYPEDVQFGWPLDLLRVDGLVDVTQVIQPQDYKEARNRLRFHLERLEAEINALLSIGRRGIHKLDRLIEDANRFLNELEGGTTSPFRYGVYITAHAATRSEVDATFNGIKKELGRVRFEEPYYRNDRAHKSDSPFYRDPLDEKQLVPTSSAASGFPFGTQPFHRDGVIYGIDVEDEIPVVLNRFNWDSHSLAVMGTLGSGKSYFSKLLLLRAALAYPDLRIIVIDPKKEYQGVVRKLGGEHRLALPGDDYRFDSPVLGYEVIKRGDQPSVEALINVLSQAYTAVSQDQKKTIIVVDEALNMLRDADGRSTLRELVLEARDINTSVQMVAQSASHFTNWKEGQDILTNIPGTVLFRHEDITDSMDEYFDLSTEKEDDLRTLPTGDDELFHARENGHRILSNNNKAHSQAFLRISRQLDTRIQVESTPLEHRLSRFSQADKALRKI